MKKIIITGSSGMLGKDIYSILSNKNKFQLLGIDKIESTQLPFKDQFIGNLTDSDFLLNTLNKVNPDIIIHCAAIVNLQICETNKSLANSVHVESTKIMANFNSAKTKLIYVSTDSVFDGRKGNYLETDKPNPLNYYAHSKLLGEEAAKKNPNHLIIRTNIFGYNIPLGKSLAEWAIENFNQKNSISGFTDIIFNAIYTKHLAKVLYELIKKDTTGTINIASVNNISKYSFLKYLGSLFSADSDLIETAISEKINFDIKRPKNTTLNVDKLLSITDVPTIEEGIDELVKDFLKE
ncbi:MAG: SDR family oxidoreductase [Flavobacteriaceae bacterium]|nr:SDR family oxidoreductase [Flavobacteriaceae bacterium]